MQIVGSPARRLWWILTGDPVRPVGLRRLATGRGVTPRQQAGRLKPCRYYVAAIQAHARLYACSYVVYIPRGVCRARPVLS